MRRWIIALLLALGIATACKDTAAQVAATQPATQAADEKPAPIFKPLTPPAFASREQRLVIAAHNGDPRWVARLIAEGADVNARFGEVRKDVPQGARPVESDRTPLIAERANVNAPVGDAEKNVPPAVSDARKDWTPLIALSQNSRAFDPVGVAKLLVEAGASVNLADEEENTPLAYAAAHDRIDLAKYLLEHGADVNARNVVGQTPIYVVGRNVQMLALLVRHGANPNNRDYLQSTPLFWANFGFGPRAIKELIDAGADVNLANVDGQTPMHIVCSAEAARLMLAAGARLDVRDKEGFTPLMRVEWSAERIQLEQHGRYQMIAYGRAGRGTDLSPLERAGLNGQMLVQRLNDLRSTETKAIAGVLKSAGAP